jgi:nucleoside 2-deoxyribosyltransferase
MRVYLAGPMTGHPENNHPEFRTQAAFLRSRGLDVVNPAELDDVVGMDREWEWYMKRDIELLVGCDAVAVLDGWRMSRGARLEVYIASALSMMVFSAYNLELVNVPRPRQ